MAALGNSRPVLSAEEWGFIVILACNPNTREAADRGLLPVPGQPGLHRLGGWGWGVAGGPQNLRMRSVKGLEALGA